MAKYNSKKRVSTIGNLLGRKENWEYHISGKKTYRNTNSNWIDDLEDYSQEEIDQFFLTYAFEGDRKRVGLALSRGVKANINKLDQDGNNALFLAVYSADLTTVKYLLNYHKDNEGFDIKGVEAININHLNNKGISALHLAVELNNIRMVKELLSSGLSANIVGKYGETPLFIATKQNNPEMLELLKKHGANMNAVNREGHTALIVASQNKSRQEAFLKLLELGADMLLKDHSGRNAFMHASNNDCSALMDIMLKRTTDFDKMVNQQDRNGVSPLMIMAKRGNREALRVLVARGANPFLKDKNGNMAIDYATDYGNPTCKEILVKTKKIYEAAEQFENVKAKEQFLKEKLGEFAKHNRVENSCIK